MPYRGAFFSPEHRKLINSSDSPSDVHTVSAFDQYFGQNTMNSIVYTPSATIGTSTDYRGNLVNSNNNTFNGVDRNA